MTQDIHMAAGQALAECAYYSEGRPDDEALEFASESVVTALKAVTGQELDRNRLENAYRSALFEREKDSVLALAEADCEKPMARFLSRTDGEISRDTEGRALFSLRQGGEYIATLMRPGTDAMTWSDIMGELSFQAGVLLSKTKTYAEKAEEKPHYSESARMIVESALMALVRDDK